MESPNQADAPALSIVCVFNRLEVREHCLDRSIAAYSGPVEVELLAIDNRDHAFTTAGAALNHGIRQARHEVVVLVHQDVYLHSIDRLAEAARAFRDGDWGVLGAIGVTHDDEFIGRIRDRMRLNGTSAPAPVEVDSLDEVLFMAPRELLLRHPLTEDPALDWHAYGVEIGLRLRREGLRVGAVDTAITHNSLTVNLVGLEDAHHHVDGLYPQYPLTRTTCGTIGSARRRWRHLPVIRDHGWRLRWLRESAQAARARRRFDAPVILSELYEEIDHVDFSEEAPLHLFNVDRGGGFIEYDADQLVLNRRDRPVVMHVARDLADLPAMVADLPSTAHVVIEDLQLEDLDVLDPARLGDRDWLLGLQPQGLWLLAGPAARDLPSHWLRPQAVPLGTRRRLTAAGSVSG